MARKARPLTGYLRDAQADIEFTLQLLESEQPDDVALFVERAEDLVKALNNSTAGIRRHAARIAGRRPKTTDRRP